MRDHRRLQRAAPQRLLRGIDREDRPPDLRLTSPAGTHRSNGGKVFRAMPGMPRVAHACATAWRATLVAPVRRSSRMKALTYHGAKDVRVETMPDPTIEADDDLVLREPRPPGPRAAP